MNLEERARILKGEAEEKVKGFVDDVNEKINVSKEKLYFAKTDSRAVIPSKRDEDAGFDFRPLIKPRETAEGLVYEQYLEKGTVSMIDTGIASAISANYYLSLKAERSSVAKYGLSVLAGTIDSGYRNEIKILVIPLMKNILISSMVKEAEEHDSLIVIPYERAIAQASLLPVPVVDVEEISYKELLNIESERGIGGFGSTNEKE